MTCTTTTSKKAMANPTSEGEETHTKEGAEATPPGIEINHVPNPQFHYAGPMVPYVESPKMDWTIDDAFHSRFMQWKIIGKPWRTFLTVSFQYFKRVLDLGKKVIQLSGDVGLDMYISWALSAADVKLQTIWTKFEEFCKSQLNATCARFFLLTSFGQGNRSIDKWYNAVQAHIQ